MLAIIGASGKIGNATLTALLNHNLIPKSQIIACTSSQPGSSTWIKLSDLGVAVRHASFDEPVSLRDSMKGVDALYLVSTPRVEMDYNDAPHGQGREAHHFAAIDAARAAGVGHIYYTSLAFGRPSVAGVMRAHIRTEEYLQSLTDIKWTIIREGLYNESWPLYLGYYSVPDDDRASVVVAGDGILNWTSIADLGIGSALILAAKSEQYAGKTLYLSTQKNMKSIQDVINVVSDVRRTPLALEIVSREEHVDHYTRKRGMTKAEVEWWVSTYNAVSKGETHIKDDSLDKLLAGVGVSPKSIVDTVKEMLAE